MNVVLFGKMGHEVLTRQTHGHERHECHDTPVPFFWHILQIECETAKAAVATPTHLTQNVLIASPYLVVPSNVKDCM